MKEIGAFALLMVIYGVSDFVSSKTKAIVSSLFAASVIILVGLWTNIIPKTVFADSGLAGIGAIGTGLLIAHMGTLISLKDFVKQWKTVLIAVAALVGIFLLVYFVGGLLVGKQYAVAAAPPISGGVIAALMMSQAAKAQGFEMAALLAILLLVLQGFIGYPVASLCLKSEAKRLSGKFKNLKGTGKSDGEAKDLVQPEVKSVNKLIPALPKDQQTPFILLAKLALVVVFSTWVAQLLNGVINKNIMYLIMGIAFAELGFLEKDILTKSNSFGLAMAGLLALVFSSLVQATPAMVVQLLWPIVATLVLGTIGIAVGSILVGKLLGQSWAMSFAIGTTALFGFPGTFILSNEISKSVGGSEEEKKYIMDEIFPKMMVSGFVTVTVGSVILAGIMVKML